MMRWQLSHRADPFARDIADRHYNRQKIGTPQFVPPGRCLVLIAITSTGRALWVTSWPFAEFVKHAWAGAWVCSAFRNENAALSSELITEAVSATRAAFGDPPKEGMITFVDRSKTKPKDIPGWCYRRAKFRHVGETKGGLAVLHLAPSRMPKAEPAMGMFSSDLFAVKASAS